MKWTAGIIYGRLNREMKTQLLDLILNTGLDQIPLDPGCPATAKSLLGVERRGVQDTGKNLL